MLLHQQRNWKQVGEGGGGGEGGGVVSGSDGGKCGVGNGDQRR